jgi:hypothetical protein
LSSGSQTPEDAIVTVAAGAVAGDGRIMEGSKCGRSVVGSLGRNAKKLSWMVT